MSEFLHPAEMAALADAIYEVEGGAFLAATHRADRVMARLDAAGFTVIAATEIATLRAALDRLACYADAASDCPYPMHDPEKCDHRYILREEVTLARAALATAKEAAG